GIDERLGNIDVQAFPNPTDGQVQLVINGQEGRKVQLTVSDLSGRVFQTQQFNGLTATFRTDLDLSGMAAGLYLLELSSEDSHSVLRIVVQ
ncbi:MAG: T9SS type A sorting domain-containing protein, partial [Bacteroidota bacterium]